MVHSGIKFKLDIARIWCAFVEYVIHSFDKHCVDCITELEDSKRCPHCETYLNLLEIERKEKNHLLNHIIQGPIRVTDEELKASDNPEPIRMGNMGEPWHLKRRRLEAEDRKKFMEAADVGVDKTVESLEKELGIKDAK